MRTESKHAERLRELGFEPIAPEESAYYDRRYEERLAENGIKVQSLSGKQLELVNEIYCRPSFTIHEDVEETHVIDEKNQRWRLYGLIDPKLLEELGFVDNTPFLEWARALQPSKP